MTLQTGRYTIVNPAFSKLIDTTASRGVLRALLAIAEIEGIGKPVFFIERLVEPGAWGLPIYRIRLQGDLATIFHGKIMLDAGIDPQEATVWIIEHQGDDIYGIVQGRIGEPIEPLAWTLRRNFVNERVLPLPVPQTKSIPPQSLFKDGQLFKINRVD